MLTLERQCLRGREPGVREAQRTDEKDVSERTGGRHRVLWCHPVGLAPCCGGGGGGGRSLKPRRSRTLLPSLPHTPTSLLLPSIYSSLSFYTSPFPPSQRRAGRFCHLPGWVTAGTQTRTWFLTTVHQLSCGWKVCWEESRGLIENLAMPTVVRKLWKSRGLPGPRWRGRPG